MVRNVTMDGQVVQGPTIDSDMLQRPHGLLSFYMGDELRDARVEAKLRAIHNTPTSALQSLQDLQHAESYVIDSHPSLADSVESLNRTVQTLRKQLHYYKSLSGN